MTNLARTLTALALSAGTSAHATIASFQQLGPFSGGYSAARSLSGDGGVVVGEGTNSANTTFAVRFQSGSYGAPPLLPGGNFASAYGASGDGSVIVGTGGSTIGVVGWRYSGGTMTGLTPLAGYNGDAAATAVSRDGSTIVGWSQSTGGIQACRWQNGAPVGLGQLPGSGQPSYANSASANGSVIVGYGSNGANRQAIQWTNGVLQPLAYLPGGFDSFANAVTPDGLTVVGYQAVFINGHQTDQAAVWHNGVPTGLGKFGTWSTLADAVTADGSLIVGRTANGGGNDFAVMWDAANGWRTLSNVLQSQYGLNLGGLRLDEATGISDDGMTICGFGENASGVSIGWVATIPSPSGALVLACGGLVGAIRRRPETIRFSRSQ